jgi:hypothetical protein
MYFILFDAILKQDKITTMQVPNRYHHSKKEQKRKLKPQALRQAKARRQALKKRLQHGDAFFM